MTDKANKKTTPEEEPSTSERPTQPAQELPGVPAFARSEKDDLQRVVTEYRTGGRSFSYRYAPVAARKTDIKAEIARKQKIANDAAEQDSQLKKLTLIILFLFLAVETALIFLFSFFQAVGYPHKFHLEEWSFKLLVAATITQITIMLNVAVRHLFPTKK